VWLDLVFSFGNMGDCVSKASDTSSTAAAAKGEHRVATTGAAAEAGEKKTKQSSSESGAQMNHALVFVKPHAANDKVVEMVKSFLKEKHVEVIKQGELKGEEIDKRGIIDSHYAHIAKIAMKEDPKSLQVPDSVKEGFEKTFDAAWDKELEAGRISNLKQLKEKTGKSAEEINEIWDKTKTFKLAPGTYVGLVSEEHGFVLNAFYGSMREVYTKDSAKVVYFVVQFPEDKLHWKDFRQAVIGATDPSKAKAGSLRNKILSQYKDLGLDEEPNVGQNGVHASAGPIEGLRERVVWTDASVHEDKFGKAVLDAGIPKDLLESWLNNERVTINGEEGNAYDLLEDINSTEALALALSSAKL